MDGDTHAEGPSQTEPSPTVIEWLLAGHTTLAAHLYMSETGLGAEAAMAVLDDILAKHGMARAATHEGPSEASSAPAVTAKPPGAMRRRLVVSFLGTLALLALLAGGSYAAGIGPFRVHHAAPLPPTVVAAPVYPTATPSPQPASPSPTRRPKGTAPPKRATVTPSATIHATATSHPTATARPAAVKRPLRTTVKRHVQPVRRTSRRRRVASRATPVRPRPVPPRSTPVPTAVSRGPYPPRTLADLHTLAGMDGADVRPFLRQVGGSPPCQDRVAVVVPPNLSGEQQAVSLLKYFYDQHLDRDCGISLFGYTDPAQYGHGFTAGRVVLVAHGGRHTLILDTGPAAGAPKGSGYGEFVVTY